MADPKVLGWCPGALRPMQSGDGLVVRIRARGGRLTAAQVAALAEASRDFGNGILDLSARANLQLRGVTPASHAPLIARLSDLGLIDASIEAETRRNILVTPFWQSGESLADLAADLAAGLAKGDAPDLPAKFGFALDGGAGGVVLRGASADIRLELQPGGAVAIYADGASQGGVFAALDAARAALALAEWFMSSGGVQGGRGRMAAHLARGARPPAAFCQVPIAQMQSPLAAPGPGPYPGIGRLIALEFGQIKAQTLAALADMAPALRLTPWRMVLLESDAALDLPGLIHDPSSALLRLTACTGAPGCGQALQPTRQLARQIALGLAGAGCGLPLHLSGCAKGCAHPGPSTLTLTATAQGFDLALNAKAGENPVETALPADPDLLTERLTFHAASL